MKQLTMITILSLAAILSACDSGTPSKQKTSATASASVDLKVVNWGPQSAYIGINPNKQPDGSMGIWIEVTGTQGLGEAQVIFGGQPAKATSVQEKYINAAILTEQLSRTGNKEVIIKQISTGKTYPVGTFIVESAK